MVGAARKKGDQRPINGTVSIKEREQVTILIVSSMNTPVSCIIVSSTYTSLWPCHPLDLNVPSGLADNNSIYSILVKPVLESSR